MSNSTSPEDCGAPYSINRNLFGLPQVAAEFDQLVAFRPPSSEWELKKYSAFTQEKFKLEDGRCKIPVQASHLSATIVVNVAGG